MPGKSRLLGGISGLAVTILLGALATVAHAAGLLDPPSNVSPPVITGTPQVSQTLTCVPGGWNGTAPISYAYQWNRDGAAIGGATGTTYVVVDADASRPISCTEQATNLAGSTSATSATVVPSALGAAPPPTAGRDTTAPALSGFRVTPRRAPLYTVLKGKGRRKVRVDRKLHFRFELSEDATVAITVRHRGRAPVQITDPGGSMTSKLARGEHSLRSRPTIKFTQTGTYTITAQATDAAGNRSPLASAKLLIFTPRR